MKLSDRLEDHFRILPAQEKALTKLGLKTIGDLLYHLPSRYGDTAEVRPIGSLRKGETATIFGKIFSLRTSKAWRKKIPMSEATLIDETGRVKLIWFHQPYMAKMVREGAAVRVEGKVSERKGALYISNPKIENAPNLFARKSHSLYPIYPESRGVTSDWLGHKISQVLASGILDGVEEPIPPEILKTYGLPPLRSALIFIHTPKREEDAMAARKRFAFEEVFMIQLERLRRRRAFENEQAFVIEAPQSKVENFVERFPFAPTGAQRRAIATSLADMRSGRPMARLLEGDVGSGKTAVAATLAYAATISRPKGQSFGTLQTAIMAPTEILARQHFENFIKFFGGSGLQIALITGAGCRKFPSKVNPSGSTDISRTQLLKWVANGEIAAVVGTHALIEKSVKFKHLALVVIDEQHRFGTAQRQKLVEKERIAPHLLSMTATPIPRTLALTLYGDLDLTLLDEMPPGRKNIITEIVEPKKRAETYEKIRTELARGRQAYVICPRIDEPDPEKELAVLAKSVKEEAKRLKRDIFPEYEVGILHSKMNAREKERIMNEFKEGQVDILVSTSVVEVGVNVENASVIVIEGAERFGLAQLHQLRGRVLRGTHQPYCFIFTDSAGKQTAERLKALKAAKNGFELAEFDLEQRGAGELSGGKQWGLSDIGMEALKNLKMVEAARAEAGRLLDEDPSLAEHPLLLSRLSSTSSKIHFE